MVLCVSVEKHDPDRGASSGGNRKPLKGLVGIEMGLEVRPTGSV